MAGWALKEFDHPGHTYSKNDLEVAVENCIAKGWLRVVSKKEVGHRPPCYSAFAKYNKWSAGVMDFTPEGFALAVRIFGRDRVEHASP